MIIYQKFSKSNACIYRQGFKIIKDNIIVFWKEISYAVQYCMRTDTMTEIYSKKVQRESEVFVKS